VLALDEEKARIDALPAAEPVLLALAAGSSRRPPG
jgi:hypothetical protein